MIDVRPAARRSAHDLIAFAATGRACAQAGWAYQLVGEPDPVVMANVRWLTETSLVTAARP